MVNNENIRVVVRARPLNSYELARGDVPCVDCDGDNRVKIVIHSNEAQTFRCDSCFVGQCNQEDFFINSGVLNQLFF